MLGHILCWLGFHKWDDTNDGLWRVCLRCGKLED